MNVLAVFAHPDDEVLGAGGTLAKHAEAGDHVDTYILCRRDLGAEIEAAAEVLGAHCGYAHYPDQQLDTVPIANLAECVRIHRDPDVVYTHHPGDLNLDHALTARAVLTAFRPKPGEKPRTILACEVLSSTEWTFPQVFAPNWFEALSVDQLNKKISALACYPSEVEPSPHPRSILGVGNLALVRGQQCGVQYAEAFQLLRRSC